MRLLYMITCMKMDISKLKELHAKIVEVRDRIEETDSKKETLELQRELDSLTSDFEDVAYELMDEIPNEINLKLTVSKIVDYDTAFVKDDIIDNILDRDNIEDLNIVEELKDAILENYYPTDYIYDEDVNVEIADDRLK